MLFSHSGEVEQLFRFIRTTLFSSEDLTLTAPTAYLLQGDDTPSTPAGSFEGTTRFEVAAILKSLQHVLTQRPFFIPEDPKVGVGTVIWARRHLVSFCTSELKSTVKQCREQFFFMLYY